MSRITTNSAAGRALRARFRHGDPVIGISKRRLAASGVVRVARVTAVEQGIPVSDATPIPAAVVIWATGFSPRFDWIRLPIFNPDGSPRHHWGVVSEAPGVYFVGLRFQRTYTSGLLGGVGPDAALIAEHVASVAI